MIYFIEADGADRVKIGYTDGDPMKRLRDLQTGSPFPLVLRAAFDGGPEKERSLHELYARWRLQGEWFAMPMDLRLLFCPVVAATAVLASARRDGFAAPPAQASPAGDQRQDVQLSGGNREPTNPHRLRRLAELVGWLGTRLAAAGPSAAMARRHLAGRIAELRDEEGELWVEWRTEPTPFEVALVHEGWKAQGESAVRHTLPGGREESYGIASDGSAR